MGLPAIGKSVVKIKGNLSKLALLLMLPFVLILAVIADILNITIAEE